MITKSASDKSNCRNNLLFTKNARTAWGHLISSYKASHHQVHVLLPAYIGYTDREGSGVFDPIDESEANYSFYKVGDRLEVDMVSFTQAIKINKPSFALVIHYFGFCPNNILEMKKICEENNVLLVEDCAHAFHLGRADQIIGNLGHASFYSLHKYLPLESGGALQINSDKISLKPLLEPQKAAYEVLEFYMQSDFYQIAAIRRRNYMHYQKCLASHELIQVLYPLSDTDIPQTFAIRVGKGYREKLYFYLMERNMPTTALYYRMIDRIPKEAFPISYEIANEILNLPVHQDTSLADISMLCEAITDFITHAQ